VKRLDDTESDYIAHLNQENAKEEREKRKIVGEQVDAFKKSFSLPLTTANTRPILMTELSVGLKVHWIQLANHQPKTSPLLLRRPQ
jgi:hypothetical protein